MELSNSHKISQEKRNFKISDVLITAWSRVQVLPGPPQSTKVSAFVLLFCSFIQFLAHLAANLFAPLVIDLRVDYKGRTGLCVSGFCGYCRHTDIGIGQQDAHEGVPEPMRMDFFDN